MPSFEPPPGLRGGPDDNGLPPINPQFKPPKGHLTSNDAAAHKKNVQTKRYREFLMRQEMEIAHEGRTSSPAKQAVRIYDACGIYRPFKNMHD